jgi:O-antigen ligase
VRKAITLLRLRSRGTSTSASRFFSRLCIAWTVLLPFLVPFDSYRNVDLQGLVLLLAGACAWLVILLKPRLFLLPDAWGNRLLTIFIMLCLLSNVITPHLGLNLLGVPHLRLGSLGLLSCIGIGLLARRLASDRLAGAAYVQILSVAVVSLGYAVVRYHGVHRIGGVFNQADVFACIIVCGIILGWQFCSLKTWRGCAVLASQLFLLALLLLTQTRAAIALVLVLSLVWLYQARVISFRQYLLVCLILAIAATAAFRLLPSSRLNDESYAARSISYRLQLNTAAFDASLSRPLFGYGPGNIADALDCRRLQATTLQQTCHDGFYFNSSHNIYLDRVLAFGWIGGLAFIGFVSFALARHRNVLDAYKLSAVLIALYYLTNVTSIVLELLFWILLLRGFSNEQKTTH